MVMDSRSQLRPSGKIEGILLVDGEWVAMDDPRIPPWQGGFCAWPGVYETIRYPLGGNAESRDYWMTVHGERLHQSWRIACAEVSADWLPAPIQHWLDWSEHAYARVAADSPTVWRLRWQVALKPGDSQPVQVVFFLPHQDPNPDPVTDRGLILVDGPTTRRVGDILWQSKRTGPPINRETLVGRELPDSIPGLTGYLPPDGSSVVQRNEAAEPCETTWGTLVWLKPSGPHLEDGGRLVVPPLSVPRLPSITLARTQTLLGSFGWEIAKGSLNPEALADGSGGRIPAGFYAVLSSVRTVVPVAEWILAETEQTVSPSPCAIRWRNPSIALSRSILGTLRNRLRNGSIPIGQKGSMAGA
jgi:branched-subunit amino acid aminotransferase/4-amino-4-deoxychorismate lyase